MAGIRASVVVHYMLALAFSFSIFVLWTAVGRAALALVQPRSGVLRPWLLAPGLGLAITLLCLMFVNQAGLPIGRATWPLTLLLGAFAASVLIRKKPLLPWRKSGLIALAAIVSLLWTGWPAFETGFNWISYGNDDMANYCLAADRFAARGFYDVPTKAELAGKSYTAYYYFMHVADMMRFGSEHIVAWTASLAHIQSVQAFMPTILALSLTQLFAAAGLVLQFGRFRRHAVVTAWILAVSPLFMLGTLYQLIAQVGGVALLIVSLAFLTQDWGRWPRRKLFVFSVLPAITGAALCIYYPETTPFAILTYAAYLGVSVLKRRIPFATAIALSAYVLIGAAVLLRFNLISYVSTLVNQASSAMHSVNLLLSLFPYFLIPTGFSNLFGWMPISRDFPEPAVTLSIVAGVALSALLVVNAIRGALRISSVALLLVVQVALAIHLYTSGNDFGLYKLAMFMQPAIAAGLAGLALHVSRRRGILAAMIGAYALTTAATALVYTQASRGTKSGGLTELRMGSQLGMEIRPPADPDAQIVCGIENVVAAKFAAIELQGHNVAMAARDRFFPDISIDYRDPPVAVQLHPHFAEMAQSEPLMGWRNREVVSTGMLWRTQFIQPTLTRPADYYVFLSHQLSLFNKFNRPETPPTQLFVLEPAASVRNRLIFVHSGRGNHYYLGDRRRIAFFQQEADPFSPGHDFNGLGRFLLLRVEHPSDEIYLRIAATRTLLPGRTEWSHSAVVEAAEERPLGIVGHGAFNLFVGPLRPQVFRGAAYVAIDFADIPRQIVDARPGLKGLYNADVPLDYRRLIGWARDVSAVDASEYRKLRRPSRIARFPEDIALASTLEFSGLYEDGWLSPDSKVTFGESVAGGCIRLRGYVPELPGSALGQGTMRVEFDGRSVELPAATGSFDWLMPIASAQPQTSIALHFSVSAKLPNGDDRPISANLQLLEVLPALTARTFDFGSPGATRLAVSGIDQDGWMTTAGAITLPAATSPSEITLEFEVPGWMPGGAARVEARLASGEALAAETFPAGKHGTLRLRLPPSTAARTLHLSSPTEFPLPSPDNRRRTVRILTLNLDGASAQ